MRKNQNINKVNFFFLILFLFLNSLLSLKSFKKVDFQDIKIYGSEFLSKKDIVKNAPFQFSTRLIFINTRIIEKELKKNLSLANVSVNRQILPFGLRVQVKTRIPVAYGEKILKGEKISGFIDEEGVFINKKYSDRDNLEPITIKVYGWQENFRKTISSILIFQKNKELDLLSISFSKNGFLTLEEKDLKTIILGFNTNLINSQLQIIHNLKVELKKNKISDKIDNIDLSDPNNPKIKVFKP